MSVLCLLPARRANGRTLAPAAGNMSMQEESELNSAAGDDDYF